MIGSNLERISNQGRYRVTGASRSTSPSSRSWRSATLVSVFPIEPISKSVVGATGVSGGDVGVAERLGGDDPVAVGDREREPGEPPQLEKLTDVGPESFGRHA